MTVHSCTLLSKLLNSVDTSLQTQRKLAYTLTLILFQQSAQNTRSTIFVVTVGMTTVALVDMGIIASHFGCDPLARLYVCFTVTHECIDKISRSCNEPGRDKTDEKCKENSSFFFYSPWVEQYACLSSCGSVPAHCVCVCVCVVSSCSCVVPQHGLKILHICSLC